MLFAIGGFVWFKSSFLEGFVTFVQQTILDVFVLAPLPPCLYNLLVVVVVFVFATLLIGLCNLLHVFVVVFVVFLFAKLLIVCLLRLVCLIRPIKA